MAYGTVKVDNVTFTYNAIDATTTFSGFYASTTNNLTLSGTASAATFTGTTANFTNVNAQNISVTTALSGLAITGGTAGFTTVTGTTVTGTTANFVTVSGTTVTGTTANFVTVSGTTVTGTTANFVTVSGTTVTGTTANFTSGVFANISGTTATFTSGIIASGTAALPSLAILSDPNTGIFSPGADQLAVATNGTGRLFINASGVLGIGAATFLASPTSVVNIKQSGNTRYHGLWIENSADDSGIGIGYDVSSDCFSYSPSYGTTGALKGHAFYTSNLERLRITSAGLVGIGTSSPDAGAKLTVSGGILSTGSFSATTGSTAGFDHNSGDLRLFAVGTSGATKGGFQFIGKGADNSASAPMTITSGGLVGIGTTSPGSYSTYGNKLVVYGTGTNGPGITIATGAADTGSLYFADGTTGNEVARGSVSYSHGDDALLFQTSATEKVRIRSDGMFEVKGAGTSGSSPAFSVNGSAPANSAIIDTSGRLLVGTSSSTQTTRAEFYGQSSSSTEQAIVRFGRGGNPSGDGDHLCTLEFAALTSGGVYSKIEARCDGTPGTNDYPGRLVFSTTADGDSSPTERVRINSAGVVQIGLDGVRFSIARPSGSLYCRGGDTGDGFIRCEDTSANAKFTVSAAGNGVFNGSLSKGSGSFKISHPLPEKTDTYNLVHSFIEGPQADLIYRGHISLVNGTAQVNIDEAGRMTEGTFDALCTNVCCFTSNETDWTPVRGHVDGNILTIEAQDPTSTAEVCWMVIGERKDQHMLDTDWTDEDGRVITEPLKDAGIT